MAKAAMAEISPGYRCPNGPERSRSGLLIISRTTIDHTPKKYAHSPLASVNLHPATAEHQPGDKATKTKREFDILYAENGPYIASVGGNGTNIGHRVSEFGIPVTVFTWGNEQYLHLLQQDLNHPRKGMKSLIEPIDAEIPGAHEMPEAIVFPVKTKHGTVDRVILGTSPLMSSAFAHVIDRS